MGYTEILSVADTLSKGGGIAAPCFCLRVTPVTGICCISRTVNGDNNLVLHPGLCWTGNWELIGAEGLIKDIDVTKFTF